MATFEKLSVFLITFFSPTWLNSFDVKGTYIWNVGQGQWLTEVTSSKCLHFDAGGEFSAMASVESLCRFRDNEIFLSHWDWDHISFVTALAQLPRVCIREEPRGFAKIKKVLSLQKSSICPTAKAESISVLFRPKINEHKSRSNDNSTVFQSHEILITGDLPKKGEMEMLRHMTFSWVEVLVVGHHGSRTSSHEKFLNSLVNLKLAIVSQRRKKYGHPHEEIVATFRQRRIPLLKTEDWGHIVIRQ